MLVGKLAGIGTQVCWPVRQLVEVHRQVQVCCLVLKLG